MELKQLRQFLNTKRVYHVNDLHFDGTDLPTIAGNPTASIATLETGADGFSGRLTTHIVGVVTITITAPVGPTAVATKTFQIAVMEHPPVSARSPTFTITQHRNGSIH